MPKVRVVNQNLAHIVRSKCITLVFGGTFTVDVVIPDQFPKAMMSGDKTDKGGAGPEFHQPQDHAVSRAAQVGSAAARRAEREQTMTPLECEFASEVLGVVLQARWPERTDTDLVAHVAGCNICSDIVIIAGAIENSRDEVPGPVGIPDSGRVWWLAQRRARLEDAEIANRPIRTTQMIALVCAVALLCAYFGTVATRFLAAIGRIASGSGDLDVAARLAAAARLLAEHAGLALSMGAVLLLVPAAAYLATGRE